MARTYENFDVQLIASGATYEVSFGSIPGQPRLPISFPLEDHELTAFMALFGKRQTRRMESPDFARVRAVGQRLFDALFTDDVRPALTEATRGAMEKGHGLRVRIDVSQARDLGTVPWEYMFFEEYDDFVSLSNWTPVVRYLKVAKPLPPILLAGPLRILTMISDPIERRGTLDVEREWSQLEAALAGPSSRGEIELHRLGDGQLETLQVDLQRNDYHVFHFIGHGEYSEDFDDGVLALEDSRGREVHVPGSTLGTYLKDSLDTRLVVLNNCEGATFESDPFTGSAQSLLRKGIPAVVAMQFEITDRAAIDFARGFYTSVGNGFPVDAALAEARKVIRGGPTRIEFGSPVLYMSADDGTLFIRGEEADIPDDVGATTLIPEVVLGGVAGGDSNATVAETPTADPDTEIVGGEPPTVEVETTESILVSDPVPPVEGADTEVDEEEGGAPSPGPVRPSDEDDETPNRRIWAFAGVALALILVSVLLIETLTGDDDPEASVTTLDGGTGTSAQSTAPSQSTVSPDPTPFVTWSRVSDQPSLGAEDGQIMHDIVEVDGLWIGVGSDATGGTHAAMWASDDGLQWNRLEAASLPTESSNGTEIRSVVQLGERLVAAGVTDGDGDDAFVWMTDGDQWISIENEDFGGEGTQEIRGLTVWEHGVVAVGWDTTDGAVWTSPDGLDWERASDPTGALAGDGNQRVHDVVPGGPGLVAVGETRGVGDGVGDFDAGIWISEDGDVWDRVDNTQAGLAGEGEQVAKVIRAGPDGLLVAGYDWGGDNGRDAAVWSSPDGVTWSQEGDRSVFGGPLDQEIHGLTQVGTGWVAAGWTRLDKENRDAAVWASDDGSTWDLVDDDDAAWGGPGDQKVEAVTAAGATVIAVGSDVSDVAIWIGQPG
jgi:hypothetical protein